MIWSLFTRKAASTTVPDGYWSQPLTSNGKHLSFSCIKKRPTSTL